MDKEHRDPHELDLTKPRLASYKQKKWKRHQDTVYWFEKQLAQRKGLKFYQTRCNAIILYDTLPAYCISRVVVVESGEIIYEKVYPGVPRLSFSETIFVSKKNINISVFLNSHFLHTQPSLHTKSPTNGHPHVHITTTRLVACIHQQVHTI